MESLLSISDALMTRRLLKLKRLENSPAAFPKTNLRERQLVLAVMKAICRDGVKRIEVSASYS
jgi:hypothetical protein